MAFSLSRFFETRRDEIIEVWVQRLKSEVGDQYAARPRKELQGTVSDAYDSEVDIMLLGDYRKIDAFINKITQMRLEAGFKLSDVQKAFELFRNITIPLLVDHTTLSEFSDILFRLNHCLSYTIHRFSDYFQSMHEKKILEHNRRLEEKVRMRTAALRESELKYKTLVEEINDGYFVVQNGTIIFANRAFCRMHGYDRGEVVGRKFYDFVAPLDREKFIGIGIDGHRKKNRPKTFEYLRLMKNEDSFPTEILSKVTLYDNFPSNIGICRDITSRVLMEKKIRESERLAYIGQITTSLSHEIRNPLSAIKMNLQILGKNKGIKGNDQRRIQISAQEVDRLEGILEELLDFAKPLQLKSETTQINDILSLSLELLEMKFIEKRMSIVPDFDRNLPKIDADGEKLGQAFFNVLLNALEASSLGSKIEIQSFGDREAGTIRVTIADEGHGVSQENVSEIFKPFFTTKSSGTGLGLSNAKRIIEAHGGRINVENRHPSGAYFSIVLPEKENQRTRGQNIGD
jgi:PAS domain S-box-containing protein